MTDAASNVIEIGPIEDGRAFVEAVAPLLNPFKSRFGALFLNDLDEPGPEHEWLIDDILSAGDKCVIGGPSQSGKSFLAIHAAMCIATGTRFFGRDVRRGLVIYQAGEGARGVKKRLRAWRKHHGVVYTKDTPFVLLRGRLDLHGSEDTPLLIAEIKQIEAMFGLPVLAIFIDTLATAAIGADENGVKDMGRVFDNIAKIAAAIGAHVCLIHHMNAGGERLRGSTMIYANIDQTIFVKRDEATKIRTAKLGKQRDDDDSLSFQFELMSIEVGHDERRDKAITSCVCVPVGEKEAIRREEEQKGFKLKTEEVNFMRAFFAADRHHGIPVPDALDTPSGVRTVVDYAEVKRAYRQSTPDHADELDAPKEGETEEAAARRKIEREKKRAARLANNLKGITGPLKRFEIIGFGQMPGDPRWFCWWTGRALRDFPQTQPKREPELPPTNLPPGFEDVPW